MTLTPAYVPNVAAFANPDSMLIPSGRTALTIGERGDKLAGIMADAPVNMGLPLPARITQYALGNVTYTQELFSGSLDVSMFLTHEPYYLATGVVPTMCPVFVQTKSRVMRPGDEPHRGGGGGEADDDEALEGNVDDDDKSMVADADRVNHADQMLVEEAAEDSSSMSWMANGIDNYACLAYVVGSRKVTNVVSDPASGPAYRIYIEMARHVIHTANTLRMFAPDDFWDPKQRETAESIVFTVSIEVDKGLHIADKVVFYDDKSNTVYRGIISSSERIGKRKLSRTIQFPGFKKPDTDAFCALFAREHPPPSCILLLDVTVDEDKDDAVLIEEIKTAAQEEDEVFPSIMYGVSGESQPHQLRECAGVLMLATIVEGTAGLVVDDTFYVEGPIRTRWHFGDYIFLVLRDTQRVAVYNDDGENVAGDDDDGGFHVSPGYLPGHMVRYEVAYYNKRDLPTLQHHLEVTDNRHVYYYVYVGLFRQTRSDPFYACCDIGQSPTVGNPVRRLHTPRPVATVPTDDEEPGVDVIGSVGKDGMSITPPPPPSHRDTRYDNGYDDLGGVAFDNPWARDDDSVNHLYPKESPLLLGDDDYSEYGDDEERRQADLEARRDRLNSLMGDRFDMDDV
jgi:hypothetical protein